MRRLQAGKLLHAEKQKNQRKKIRIQKTLQVVQETHSTQRS